MACHPNSPTPSSDNRPAATAPMEGVALPEEVPKALTITPLEEEEVDVYGGIAFTDVATQETLAFVNPKAGKGKIIINGKELALTAHSQVEGSYTIEGKGVKLSTTAAQYEEQEADCLYGTITKLTVSYDNINRELENIQVQDCAHLGE